MTGHETPPAVLSEELVTAAAAAAPVTASSRTDDIPVSWDERTVLTTMLGLRAGHRAREVRRAQRRARPPGPAARLAGHIDILREMADGQTGR